MISAKSVPSTAFGHQSLSSLKAMSFMVTTAPRLVDEVAAVEEDVVLQLPLNYYYSLHRE